MYMDSIKNKIIYNTCKTCGANNGRAGLLIDKECENCYDTRTRGEICIHLNLKRTDEEIQKTMEILN